MTDYERLLGTPERRERTLEAIASTLPCLERCRTCWWSGECWKQGFLLALLEEVDDGE